MTQLKDSMSNIEKIRQEIERRKKVYLTKNGFPKGTFGAIKIETYEGLLAFIDSLPEEKPSEDFPTSDEEMAKFLATHPKVEVPEKYKTPNWFFDKQPSEDKEEVAEKYADKHGFRVPYDGSNNYYDDVDVKASKEGFLAGAEWALNQGVKATGIISPRGIIYDNNIGYRLFLERYHNGDKVEVQVRKIEENGK